MLHPGLQESARAMRGELERQRLTVVLIPCRHGRRHRKIRAVEERNPGWYRQLCAEWPSQRSRPRRRRKPDTAIKRAGVLRALGEMANGRCETVYAHRLLPYVFEHYAAHLEMERVMVEESVTHRQERSAAGAPIYL